MALKPSSDTQRRTSRTAAIGFERSTEPTPTSRPPDSATKRATSSFEIMTLRGATQALIRLRETPPCSIAASVAATGTSPSGIAPFVQRRSDSKIGSPRWRAVGCWAQASMIMAKAV